jgi:hypothetical protein
MLACRSAALSRAPPRAARPSSLRRPREKIRTRCTPTNEHLALGARDLAAEPAAEFAPVVPHEIGVGFNAGSSSWHWEPARPTAPPLHPGRTSSVTRSPDPWSGAISRRQSSMPIRNGGGAARSYRHASPPTGGRHAASGSRCAQNQWATPGPGPDQWRGPEIARAPVVDLPSGRSARGALPLHEGSPRPSSGRPWRPVPTMRAGNTLIDPALFGKATISNDSQGVSTCHSPAPWTDAQSTCTAMSIPRASWIR